jgi:hypothetical protein
VPAPLWLLLAHQLPTRPSNARVKTWRRLQEIGAVPTRNSVYVLPNTDQCREDFEWLRSEIVAFGGEATVFAAEPVDREESNRLIDRFRKIRADDYRRLKRDSEKLLASLRGKRTAPAARRSSLRRAIRNLREQLSKVDQIDFFRAPGRDEVTAALASLDRVAQPAAPAAPAGVPAERLSIADFQHRRWVTRPRPGVDRMASAWLIRRHIDPDATFAFVERAGDADIPFDMYEGEFSHHGALCTFETLARRFGIDDSAVLRLAQIVHDLDMKDARFGLPETSAIGYLVDGLRQLHSDDRVLLEQGMAMYEALARSFATAGAASGSGRPRRARSHTTTTA